MLDRVLRAVVDENEGREDDYVLSFIYVGCIYGSGRVDFAARHQLHMGGSRALSLAGSLPASRRRRRSCR
jgi:hypothetical protein